MAGFEALQAMDPPQVGSYRIEARLGMGGMGCVYLGRSRSGRAVAVKVVRPELAGDREFQRRFSREVAVARTVSGFFTAGVVDADPTGSPPWLATAYVPGTSLAEALAEHGPWPEMSVLALGAGLAEALSSIHEAGVVHRDLKPSNVLLAADGPRVIDFGISVALEGTMLTQTGQAVGTPGFMSPEQLTGAPVGPAGDVFCLGAMLMFTATGVGPFGTGQWQALAYRTVYEEPNLDALPPGLRAVVARCLAKQADQRPPVTELLEELADRATDAGMVGDVFTQAMWLPESVAHVVRTRTASPQPTRAGVTVVTGNPAPEAVPVRPPLTDATARRPEPASGGPMPPMPPSTGDQLQQHRAATAVIERSDDATKRRASNDRAPRPAAIPRDRRTSADFAETHRQSVEPRPVQLPAETMPQGVRIARAFLYVQAALMAVTAFGIAGLAEGEPAGVSLALGLPFAVLLGMLAGRCTSRHRWVRTITRTVEGIIGVIHLITLLLVPGWDLWLGRAVTVIGSISIGLIVASTVIVGMSRRGAATWFTR